MSNKYLSWVVAFLLFVIPSNLFFKLSSQGILVHGLRVDYLIPKLYLSDLVLLVLVGGWWWWRREQVETFKIHPFLLLGIALLCLRQFFLPYPLTALWPLTKVGLIIWFGWWLTNAHQYLKKPLLIGGLLSSLTLQSLVGLYQFLSQSSLFGYWFLGEPNLSLTLGLAKMAYWGQEFVLPYGTTAHPNVLAGVLVLYWLLAWQLVGQAPPKIPPILKQWLGVVSIPTFIVIILTGSVSAWLSLFLGIFIFSWQYFNQLKWSQFLSLGLLVSFVFFTPLLLFAVAQKWPPNPSLTRRVFLNQTAIDVWWSHPLIGVGYNQFTRWAEEFSQNQEIVRFIQPTHHVGLLFVAETGALGLGLALLISYYLRNIWRDFLTPLAIVAPILSLDHYLYTLQTGLLLVALIMGLRLGTWRSRRTTTWSRIGR